MNDLVKCCNCGWRGLEGELVSFSDDSGGGYGCPNCKTDEYLSDVIGDKMDNFVKITTGWVRQYYEPNKDGIFVCTGQEFIAGDIIEFVDDFGDDITPPDRKYREYQPFDMVKPKSI